MQKNIHLHQNEKIMKAGYVAACLKVIFLIGCFIAIGIEAVILIIAIARTFNSNSAYNAAILSGDRAAAITAETNYDLYFSQCITYLIILLCTIGAVIILYYELFSRKLYLTNKRLVYVRGCLFQRTTDIPLHKIHSVSFSENFIERLFSFGSLHVVSSFLRTIFFMFLNKPKEMYEAIELQLLEEPSQPAPQMTTVNQITPFAQVAPIAQVATVPQIVTVPQAMPTVQAVPVTQVAPTRIAPVPSVAPTRIAPVTQASPIPKGASLPKDPTTIPPSTIL